MWRASLRLILVLFGFLLVSAVLGLLVDFEHQSEERSFWLGLGFIVAFLAGIVLFFAGLWKAWKARASTR
jgi:uncharacterized membrane protein HdeD (DUF308 family)